MKFQTIDSLVGVSDGPRVTTLLKFGRKLLYQSVESSMAASYKGRFICPSVYKERNSEANISVYIGQILTKLDTLTCNITKT